MISVIIPTFNDEQLIRSTVSHLKENAYTGLLKEIIVVDAGSTDGTVREATEAGAVIVTSVRRERGAQMNLGAQSATGKILYFLFPGTLPPKYFTNEIVRSTLKGFSFGSFTASSDCRHWILKMMKRFSKSKIDYTRVDNHSLFVLKELFEKTGRFREDMMIMEDREMIERLKRYAVYTILKEKIEPPAAKLPVKKIFPSEFCFMVTWIMYSLGYPQSKLVKVYRWLSGRKTVVPAPAEGLSASLTS